MDERMIHLVTAELMQYFMNSNGYNEHFAKTSQRVMQFKETNEGVNEMALLRYLIPTQKALPYF